MFCEGELTKTYYFRTRSYTWQINAGRMEWPWNLHRNLRMMPSVFPRRSICIIPIARLDSIIEFHSCPYLRAIIRTYALGCTAPRIRDEEKIFWSPANTRLIRLRGIVVPGNKEVDSKFNSRTAGIRMHAHSWLRRTRESGGREASRYETGEPW